MKRETLAALAAAMVALVLLAGCPQQGVPVKDNPPTPSTGEPLQPVTPTPAGGGTMEPAQPGNERELEPTNPLPQVPADDVKVEVLEICLPENQAANSLKVLTPTKLEVTTAFFGTACDDIDTQMKVKGNDFMINYATSIPGGTCTKCAGHTLLKATIDLAKFKSSEPLTAVWVYHNNEVIEAFDFEGLACGAETACPMNTVCLKSGECMPFFKGQSWRCDVFGNKETEKTVCAGWYYDENGKQVEQRPPEGFERFSDEAKQAMGLACYYDGSKCVLHELE